MGSDLARANLSTDIRKQLMKHSKIEATLEYSHLSQQDTIFSYTDLPPK
jgi:hypothetical protein